jgi:LPS-assembly protein
MKRVLVVLGFVAATACSVATAHAQINIAGFDNMTAFKQEQLGEHHYLLTGAVELQKGDTSIYADSVEYFQDEDRAIARGNVVVSQGANRIASDWAEFNTKTQLGTFHQASGIATVRQGPQRPVGGGLPVPGATTGPVDNDVYYFGETVEKLGPKKYKITNGGFSTCVQPTPRWDLSADTIVLNIDHYTTLRQALLNVKGVPMLYLPFLYYPTKEDERATGFLIPTYGVSTIRGHSLHNAFFWAIDRSRDATFLADWFSKTGYGTGAQYRYNYGGGTDGQISGYLLDQRTASYLQPDGSTTTVPASESFTLRGTANQVLPHNFRLRAQIDYFSSFATNQTFNMDVLNASLNRRSYTVSTLGFFHGFSLNAMVDRSEWFSTETDSQVIGDSPRVTLTRTEHPVFGQIYFGGTAEYSHLDRLVLSDGQPANDQSDHSVGRFDFAPQIRYPFKRWLFLTVNTTLQWRETFYTRSIDPVTQNPLDTSINRQYFTAATQIVGPTFTRIFDTPGNGYAEKFKHTIEPYVTLQRTSSIDNVDHILKNDTTDYAVGDTTSISYGLNNRLYARRRLGRIAQSQEIVALEISQTYFSNPAASASVTTYSTPTITNFSPIALNLRVTPTPTLNATARAEIDSKYHSLRTIAATTAVNWQQRLTATIGWSKNFLVPGLPGFDTPSQLSHYLNVATNLQTRDRRYGLIYSFNYDLLRDSMLQERISGFYNAQCCGLAFEYQRYNYSNGVVPADHRFFLSFTLAGLGNFSPFNGALGGVPH